MLKFKIIISLLAVASIASSCLFSKPRIIYSFGNNAGLFEFESTDPDTIIKERINFWTMDLRQSKEEPVYVNFIFSEGTPNVEKLESIKTHLYAKDNEGKYVEQEAQIELDIDYFDGKIIQKISKKENDTQLNKLIDWKKVNYSYEFAGEHYTAKNNNVTFQFTHKYYFEKYPDTLKLKIDFKWSNGERSYESLMIKGEYTPAGWNLKY